MAAALQCEICGGKLVGKPGGIFECDSCGMEYSTEWAKAKIQEIRGTVQVEGTVEVTGSVKVDGGTVQVEGAANKDSLLKRGFMACEDGEWRKAREYFDQALNSDAECGEAYLGLLMAQVGTHTLEELFSNPLVTEDTEHFQKAIRFCDEETVAKLQELANDNIARLSEEKAREEELKQAEIRAKQEKEARYWAEIGDRLAEIRQRNAAAAGRLAIGKQHIVALSIGGGITARTIGDGKWGECQPPVKGLSGVVVVAAGSLPTTGHTVGLRYDGTVFAMGYSMEGRCDVKGWSDIIAIDASSEHTVGLRADGTVVATGNTKASKIEANQITYVPCARCDVAGWREIIAVAAGKNHTVGLRKDGTVVAVGDNAFGQLNVTDWHDIVGIAAGLSVTAGLRSNGTVVAAGPEKIIKDVEEWRDIVAIAADEHTLVGLKANGTVVNTKSFHSLFWKDIVAIATGGGNIAGITADGGIVTDHGLMMKTLGLNEWHLFDDVRTIRDERKHWLLSRQNDLKEKHTEAKGILQAARRKQLESQLAEIEAELQTLG